MRSSSPRCPLGLTGTGRRRWSLLDGASFRLWAQLYFVAAVSLSLAEPLDILRI